MGRLHRRETLGLLLVFINVCLPPPPSCCASFLSREGFSRPFPSSSAASNIVYVLFSLHFPPSSNKVRMGETPTLTDIEPVVLLLEKVARGYQLDQPG